jgi:hypothetical protein
MVDSDAPSELRGAVLTINDAGYYPFADEQALLALLHRLASAPAAAQTHPEVRGAPGTISHPK